MKVFYENYSRGELTDNWSGDKHIDKSKNVIFEYVLCLNFDYCLKLSK